MAYRGNSVNGKSKYTKRDQLGDGAYAKVYLAYDETKKTEVAIKRALLSKEETLWKSARKSRV